MPQVPAFLRLSCWGVLLLLSSPTFAAEFSGRVVGVIEGDDVLVLHDGLKEDVRLNGIDCPEKGQAYGERAKEFTTRLALRKTVRVLVQGADAFGRTLGKVVLPDGRILNHELVKAGLAWWFRQYAPENAEVARFEKEAREAKRGLWRDARPLPPWVFRKFKERKKGSGVFLARLCEVTDEDEPSHAEPRLICSLGLTHRGTMRPRE